MRSILYTGILLCSLRAAAEPSGVVQQAPTPSTSRDYHRFGVLLDAGVPDGIGVSGLFRPIRWVRLELGLLENTVSPGIRGGATLLPFNYWITPTLTVEGGHYFPGNANTVVRKFARDLGADKAILNDFNYNFVNGHVGLEIGSRVFAFYLRVGESYVSTTLRNVQQFLQQEQSRQQGSRAARIDSAGDISASYRGPSAKLGFVVYFM